MNEPFDPLACYNLGVELAGLGRAEEAERCYREAIAHQPDFVEARYNLACLLMVRGRREEAELAFRELLALKPDHVEALNNRGNVLCDLGWLEEAERSYRAAIAARPGHALAHNNLGNVLRETGRHEEAEACYRRAIALKPDLADAHDHLGNSLLDLARLPEAGDSYRIAMAVNPGLARAHSNYLLHLNYVPGLAPAAILAEHRAFERHVPAASAIQAHVNSADPARRLRLGYVSGDLRSHSIAYFIEPVLTRHDRAAFEVFCYYNFPRADAVTHRLMTRADHWRDVHRLDDAALAQRIRADAIDILVDLSGHTGQNRLPVFALRPAPVQAAYLGYPATTGLAAMDYRITDAIADPPEQTGSAFCERLVRLPHSMWCYQPDDTLPAVGPLPDVRGGVAFGSFNYYAKLNDAVVALWARLLQRLPGSRLIVTRLPGAGIAEALARRFGALGIARDQLELHPILPRERYVELFARTHIALDPFPYAGTTTTCDVLWMGIPVVTLAGETSAARSGASLLRAVGLGELVARSTGEYLDIAEALARDPRRVAEMRSGLRERMRASPLMDAARFTRDLEGAFRAMWQAWCKGQAGNR